MSTVIETIVQSIRESFPELEEVSVTAETRLGEIPGWDSMAAVNLQVCLESSFHAAVPEELLGGRNKIGEILAHLAAS